MLEISFDVMQSAAIAALVALVGRAIVKRVKFFQTYCVPGVVVAGLLVSIVLGIYLIMQPGAATVALCSLIGWLILLAGAAGAVNSVIFQRATFMTSPLLPVSVAGIMVGLFFITRPYTLVEIVGLIICVFLMIQGMTSIQTAVNRKRWGDTLWWVPLIIGIACVLLGVYALFAPGASTALMMRIAGIMLAFSGVVNMIAAFALTKQ